MDSRFHENDTSELLGSVFSKMATAIFQKAFSMSWRANGVERSRPIAEIEISPYGRNDTLSCQQPEGVGCVVGPRKHRGDRPTPRLGHNAPLTHVEPVLERHWCVGTMGDRRAILQ